MNNPETRASLILRLGNPADDAAWTDFLEIYEPMLYRLASRWGLQNADAEEVVQETLLGVSKAIADFSAEERPRAFRSWLATITRNKLVDHLARRSRQAQGSGDTNVHRWLDQRACESSSASVWDWQQKQQLFAWAAEKVRHQVSEVTWKAFHRTSVRGESTKEVAADLGIREGMVYVARSRVMARLRQAVQQWQVDMHSHDNDLGK
ncbi:ECF RNA polymerase sigma factor SigE [Planctomycetes bacterium CA13]|uniref:ECF RNA polymerase sigma factor SigE n=1 Tax=Novipirellula herctigrandis TaxID=2527986 RepID=A0A5C5ZB07_9BACT|nr:ECF RNA polymerase sigma factor SigE [Planctomycetes bacterium CA13]